jgi:hypothetical protein
MNGIAINRIPGFKEAIAEARAKQARARENAWKNISTDICGFKILPMTVLDFVILEQFGSPFINRKPPQLCDVCFLLWALSRKCRNWNLERGWRKFHLPFSRSTESFLYSARIRRFFSKHPDKFESAVKAIFEYVDTMFMDAPPTVQANNSTGISYLTGWFDLMQGEHHMNEDKIWLMPLPQLFQRVLAIYRRKGIKVPVFNHIEDKLKSWVQMGIATKRFTFDDLATGKVKFGAN